LIITAEGELRPVTRRDIFAARSGIIREVLVEHGVEVVAGQELARLSDPAGELDLTRLEGELHTIEARLATLRAARIQAADGGASGRLSQLVGEEAELLERRTALEAQRHQAVVDREATRIVSPMAGRILTWNVAERLTGRPVEHGESLLSVGNVAGSWEITAELRERDVAPVLEALRSRPEGLSVRFAAVAAGGPPGEARLTEVARVVEENARLEPVVRVTMRCVDTPASAEWRPGTAVLPRIDCGRHSLGFVWFRDLRTALQRWWWIGW
jgi:biotin carboxyl carrier protein